MSTTQQQLQELKAENEKLKEVISNQAKEIIKLKANEVKDGDHNNCATVLEVANSIHWEQLEALKAENKKLTMKSNVQSDLIDNLFLHRVRHAGMSLSGLDDGISITDEFGHKYIDMWNKEYDELIKKHIENMNEYEFDGGLKLVFHSRDNIEFVECAEEELPESEDVGGLDTK